MLKEERDFPKITIIILNWNGWKDTIECLESLIRIKYPNYEIILVDNASSDDSIRKIEDYCEGKLIVNSKFFNYNQTSKPLIIKKYEYINIKTENFDDKDDSFLNINLNRRIRLIINDKNYGFTKGNNIGMKFAIKLLKPEYILLLNNDTIVKEDFLLELIDIAEKDKNIGVLGPKVCFYDFPNRNQFPHLQNINEPFADTFISGAAFLIRMEVIKKIGFLDENYFFRTEDKDYCYTAREAGYKVLYIPTKSIVYHKAGATKSPSGFRLYYKTRNTILFKKKHLSNLKFFFFLGRFFMITFFMEMRRYPTQKNSFLRGVKDGLLLIIKEKTLLTRKWKLFK